MKKIIGCICIAWFVCTTVYAAAPIASLEGAVSLYLKERGEMARLMPPFLPAEAEGIVGAMETGDFSFQDLPRWYVLFLMGSIQQTFLPSSTGAIGVFEDLEAGEIVVLDETQQVLAVFPAPLLPASATVEEWAEELHVRRFVLWLQLKEPPETPALARSGIAPMSAPRSAGNDFSIAGLDFPNGGHRPFVMMVDVPSSFTGKVDIYETDDLVNGEWTLTDVSVPTYAGQSTWYPLVKSLRGDMKFYFAADGSTDSDGDGYPDTYERYMLGSNSNVADSVEAGVSDGPYWPGGAIQAGPASILIQEDSIDENPMASGTLAIYNPRAKAIWERMPLYASGCPSVSVPGSFNGWNTSSHQLFLVGDYLWEGVFPINGSQITFKFFTADTWFGASNAGSVTLPAMGSLATPGNDILIQGLTNGNLRFLFCETSKVYSVEATVDPPITLPVLDFTVSSAGRMLWYAEGGNARGFGQIHGGIFFNYDEDDLYVGVAGLGCDGTDTLLILLDTDGENGGVSTLAGLSGDPTVLGNADNIHFGTGFTPNVAIVLGDRRITGRNDWSYGGYGQGVFALSPGAIQDFPGFSTTLGKLRQWGDRSDKQANAGAIAALSLGALGLNVGDAFQAAAIICGGPSGANRWLSGEAYGESIVGTLNVTNSSFEGKLVTLTGLPVTLVTNEAPERSTAQLFTDDDVMLQAFYWNVPEGSGANWYSVLENQLNAGDFDPFTHIWMPPPSKANSGGFSSGYDPYDFYDIGGYFQKQTTRTRYGTEAELRSLINRQRSKNIQPIVDLVLNHMNGGGITDTNTTVASRYNYTYPLHRRFQKPNYNNTNHLFNINYVNYPFGYDHGWGNNAGVAASNSAATSADINHRNPIQRDGLKAFGDWLTHNVGYSGYRFDYTQCMEPWFISEFMRGRIKRDRFAVMEYWTEDWDASTLERLSWLDLTDNTACLFDFQLHQKLADMCNNNGTFDMASLASDALIWSKPERTITFVESHDTIRPYGDDNTKLGIMQDKMLAYAFILIADGMPMVAYNDYLVGPYVSLTGNGWTGAPLKNQIDDLIYIRRAYAVGKMTYLSNSNGAHLLALKRSGNTEKPGCILMLNASLYPLSDTLDTGWPNATLVDVLDANITVQTDAFGHATLNAPARAYRVYVPVGVVP